MTGVQTCALPISVEVDDDAECVAVLPFSKSPPPQPKLVLPQVQLVKVESPARLAPGSRRSRIGAVFIRPSS